MTDTKVISEQDQALMAALQAPFEESELEWRALSDGFFGQKYWMKLAPYVTNRAIMNRLDNTVGPFGWQNMETQSQFRQEEGFICTIMIRNPETGGWVSKMDGAPLTQFEAFKGGISDSMKRSAVQWGIGRYLYEIDDVFAEIKYSKGSKAEGWRKGFMNEQEVSKKSYGRVKGKLEYWWNVPDVPSLPVPGRPAAKLLDPTRKAAQKPDPENEPLPKTETPVLAAPAPPRLESLTIPDNVDSDVVQMSLVSLADFKTADAIAAYGQRLRADQGIDDGTKSYIRNIVVDYYNAVKNTPV
jgi:hypothetical protein